MGKVVSVLRCVRCCLISSCSNRFASCLCIRMSGRKVYVCGLCLEMCL